MTMWQPGMRAVCVDDSPCFAPVRPRWLRWLPYRATERHFARGQVYTVHSVHIGWHRRTGEEAVVLCMSEVNPDPRAGGVKASRFRPLSETRLDQFKAHLVTPPREKVGA